MSKVMFLGTGSIMSTRNSACALVDDRILVDLPNGITKRMKNHGIDPKSIQAVCITHYHGDHVFDLPFFLLEVGLRQRRTTPLFILGPSEIADRTWQYLALAFPESVKKVQANIQPIFIEMSDGFKAELDAETSVESLTMNHDNMESYGYIVNVKGKTIGFTGDSSMCDNVLTLINRCETSILDMTFAKSTAAHMGRDTIIDLAERFAGAGKSLFTTHMTDEVRYDPINGVTIPDDFDTVIL